MRFLAVLLFCCLVFVTPSRSETLWLLEDPTYFFSYQLKADYQQNQLCLSSSFFERIKQFFAHKKGCYPVIYKTKTAIKFQTPKAIQTYSQTRQNKDVYELIQDSQVFFDKPKKIAILYISTGRYIYFWERFYQETQKYFLPRHEKTYFLFTDHDELEVPQNVVKIHQDQLKWPYITLMRYHMFLSIEEKLKEFDYIYFMNGTLLPVKEINEEIFPTPKQKITVSLNAWWYRMAPFQCVYDRNEESPAYVAPLKGKYYLAGGFNGGIASEFLKLSHRLKQMTDEGLEKNIIPRWHDESIINRWLVDVWPFQKPLLLMPTYILPEEGYFTVDEFKDMPDMIVLDKKRYGAYYEWFRGEPPKRWWQR